jgi:RNA polymerase sigma-70 factor (ECF subfamily)
MWRRDEQLETLCLENYSQVDRYALVERFQSGEIAAFEEIVDRCQKHVYNLAYRITHNHEDSHDISQEVFMKVFRSLSKLKNISAFDPWLRRVTINACMDYLRRQPNEHPMEDFDFLTHESISTGSNARPDKPLESGELGMLISRAVDQLPNRQKKVFVLRHYEGLALKDIARSLNCSLGTVKAHLFRATRRLRKLLQPYVSQHA